ncbi:ABC transporter ATP-binding protein [Halomonas daqingensis]|uniref:ABC transporter ATP-binding protein n=1 Tax=Billgrantia desiderata TaxID=52021 RepID=A0AAW4YVI3_9GAMM|nr:ABC transporter ATP-binding protein [Halomonas desiderata]MCE8010319.1 ABC transporter ATP-binding protein [Halomonas desiderata]MCE8029969.1 ABC transporter ATP-binding protein [Halomonas desiderata]MCE8052259.1 ABC transporter ATP-binding protein [Halomonas desiderata]OUE40155.1 ABC transporter ATP-binding protein [Halomonas desiderata SP1]SEG28653.1 amino acid/amide ABC transporter ATP-binding protein 1, HAAT family [Halomonas desiderata]
MAEAIIETRQLTKSFRGFKAVNDISIRVEPGTIHALIGANGAGKTTCFNLLTKFLEPSAGSIFFKGRDITRLKPDQVARLGMVRSFQISAVFSQLTVLENVKLALQRRRGESYDFWATQRRLDEYRERAMDLLEEVGLSEWADTPAAELPYGRKRALELATTLALDPELMLLDEPLAGMGTEDVGRTAELIRRVAAQRTVLMVEHNLGVVAELCDRITVLARGEVLVEGDYATVSRDERVIESYIGGAQHD